MTVEERLALLEQRLRRAEDELAIARLLAAWIDETLPQVKDAVETALRIAIS